MNLTAWLALAAAALLVAALLAAHLAPAALAALTAVLVAALWAYVLWRTRGARIRDYHRHRYQHAKCHARPTLTRRVRLAARWLASVRIHITTTARTA